MEDLGLTILAEVIRKLYRFVWYGHAGKGSRPSEGVRHLKGMDGIRRIHAWYF
jgi:hypothetical protein